MFRVGQKVVCVDDRRTDHLEQGQVYICTGVEDYCGRSFVRVDCCAPHQKMNEGWFCSRFRPIVERKTDISIFTKMIKTERADVS